jgi:hypothetical protein
VIALWVSQAIQVVQDAEVRFLAYATTMLLAGLVGAIVWFAKRLDGDIREARKQFQDGLAEVRKDFKEQTLLLNEWNNHAHATQLAFQEEARGVMVSFQDEVRGVLSALTADKERRRRPR